MELKSFLSEEELPIFRSFMEDTSETKDFADREDSFITTDSNIIKTVF